jgi:bifunctional non-homologous end joining protein LigD
VRLPQLLPMLLGRKAEPFNDPEYLFELKYDGFRAIAIIHAGECTLVSRNGNAFKSFESLRLGLPRDLRVHSAVLDGEIACLDSTGRPVFDDLFYRRREPVFVAFDVLSIGGDDLRCHPLSERKQELRRVLKSRPLMSLYCSHVEGAGKALFEAACQHDLEGIVGKHKSGSYISGRENTTWFKVRNPNYSQLDGRNEMFDRPHEPKPVDIVGWGACRLRVMPLNTRRADISHDGSFYVPKGRFRCWRIDWQHTNRGR